MCHGQTRLPAPTYFGALLAALLTAAMGPAFALAGEPEYPASRLGVQTAPILLLSRADVKAELTLTPEQAASAERTITDLYVRAASLHGKRGPEAVAARRAIDQAMQQWIETQLTAAQRTRLVQLDLQWEGTAALVTRPIMADSLGLTQTQRQALEEAVKERDGKRSRGQYGPPDERKLAANALKVVLTPEQSTRWLAMLGQPFTFTPEVAAAPKPTGATR
jgi:hypothetical protein